MASACPDLDGYSVTTCECGLQVPKPAFGTTRFRYTYAMRKFSCSAIQRCSKRNGCYAVVNEVYVSEQRQMKYVYILQSEMNLERFYIGCTTDLDRRLKEHNGGHSTYTNKYKPWQMKTYIAFRDHKKADDFEVFLKTGNGRLFAKKRL